jgi:putative thioredoxin
MEPILGSAPRPADAAGLIKDSSTADFMADVIDASHDAAVVVDFWAPWCGPCKQLGPALEKAVRDARGAVRLVKINIDENPELAQQMRIQSIPAVYAFKDGRPVDGFVGALPESQVKQFVARLAGGAAGPSPIEEALALAKEALAAGDTARAANIYTQILQHEPGTVEAVAGLARIAIDRKEFAKARQLLDRVPKESAQHAEVTGARTALELAEAGVKAQGAVGGLRARLEANPGDHEARFELASALFGAGEREQAVDELLELVRRDRKWNEEAARKQLVKFFEAMGHADPLTVAARKRLSSILFS